MGKNASGHVTGSALISGNGFTYIFSNVKLRLISFTSISSTSYFPFLNATASATIHRSSPDCLTNTLATYEGSGSIAPHNGGGCSSCFGNHTGILIAVTCNNLRNNTCWVAQWYKLTEIILKSSFRGCNTKINNTYFIQNSKFDSIESGYVHFSWCMKKIEERDTLPNVSSPD
ncbi:hypothetical protein AGLY_010807 [Aphis glycines]|uniref:Uncharacterized protein n=1 Tax=Aphis glycines TaxID=307491 RepID=A0A6G0TFI0_APHGL|nr:hypothetical protein AGLY_010807 [Aphis glycines]